MQSFLSGLIEGLLENNLRIFLIYPVPEMALDISRINWKFYNHNKSLLDSISIPMRDFESRNKFVVEVFDSFAGRRNLYAVKPSEVFCDTYIKNRCVAQHDTVPFYYDDDHLSDVGAKMVVDKFFAMISP